MNLNRPASTDVQRVSPRGATLSDPVRLTPGLKRRVQVVVGTFGYMTLLAFAMGMLIVVGCTNTNTPETVPHKTTFKEM
jgi:hypothetical protein